MRKNPALGYLMNLTCTGVAITLHPDDRMNRSEIIDGVETIHYMFSLIVLILDGVPNNTIPVLPIICKRTLQNVNLTGVLFVMLSSGLEVLNLVLDMFR